MRRALVIAGLLGVAALAMAARPTNEFTLVQQLNGQPTRWVLPDGGSSGVFTQFDGGTLNNRACMPLLGGITEGGIPVVPNVLLFVPLTAVNMCERPSVFAPLWDGGCNTLPTDQNMGVPLAAGVPQYTTPDSNARSLCFVTDAGFLSVPVWFAQ